MTASIGEILTARPLPDGQRRSTMRPRTGEPVRRHSHRADRTAPQYRQKITKREAWEIVHAAQKYDDAGRAKGGKRPLGEKAIKILRYLANLAAYSGRVEPSYDYLMEKTGCARDTVNRALKALRAHGFLDWVRRYIPTGNTDGPQVQQTSNAYRLALPAIARRLLGRFAKPAPVPDDVLQAAKDRADQIEAMRATLTMTEQIALDFGADDATGQALARLWQSMQQRESENRTELGDRV